MSESGHDVGQQDRLVPRELSPLVRLGDRGEVDEEDADGRGFDVRRIVQVAEANEEERGLRGHVGQEDRLGQVLELGHVVLVGQSDQLLGGLDVYVLGEAVLVEEVDKSL